jgi:hypothetical protein
MVHESLESIRLAGEQGARQFRLSGPVHALILACRGRCPLRTVRITETEKRNKNVKNALSP